MLIVKGRLVWRLLINFFVKRLMLMCEWFMVDSVGIIIVWILLKKLYRVIFLVINFCIGLINMILLWWLLLKLVLNGKFLFFFWDILDSSFIDSLEV